MRASRRAGSALAHSSRAAAYCSLKNSPRPASKRGTKVAQAKLDASCPAASSWLNRLGLLFVTFVPLSVAQRVVNLHGGRIRLEDRPGGGTRAVIAFPAERVEQNRYVS